VVTPGASLVVTFNVKVDGVNNDSFTLRRAYVVWDNTAIPTGTLPRVSKNQRDTITDNVTLVSNGSGNYTVTVPTAFQIDNSTYLFQLQDLSGASQERPVVTFNWQAGAPLRDFVTDSGCASCHGPYPAWQSPNQKAEPFRHYAVGGSKCTICHSNNQRNVNIISRNAAGALVDTGALLNGTNLVEYVHGIHNSHNMPPDRTYFRTTDDPANDPEDRYSIGYPSSMRNCKVCHETTAQLAAVTSAPVSYWLCMSCHNNWDGFVDHNGDKIMVGALATIHTSLNPITTNCMLTGGCHGSLPAANEAADFHNFFSHDFPLPTGPDIHLNSFYRGTDISYDNPDNVSFAITGVTVSGDNVTFTWTASKLGSAVNPCNDNLAAGPKFRTLSAYLSYAKGDDWVNEKVGSSPGQPAGSLNLFTGAGMSTTCAANVATTRGLKIDPDALSYASKAQLSLGGKPETRGTFTIGSSSVAKDYFVRVSSPIYAFNMTTGAHATERREAVVDAKCLKCHRGTLYQHGGDRVDNEHLCVVCHNPSAGEKNVRQVTYKIVNSDNTVNTDKTYDGKVNETYDMRYMIHSIHGIDKRQVPLVIYRGRGIYAFVTPDTVPPTGWPLVDGEPPPVSDNTAPVYGSTNGSTQIHNWTVVHYPQAPSECQACHAAGKYEAPDQTKAVALTIDPGTSFTDQSDDTVIGPAAAACTACHTSAAVRSHANQFGYRTVISKDAMLLLAQP
jgi:OmcA/MtrC family decaheme c-type cytochrome